MASLYELMPGITVTSTEILEAELLAMQILQSKFPDMDLREGTGVRDLTIRPTATLLAMINKATAYYLAQNTIAGVTDDTDSDIVDNILSNWFLERKSGTQAVISARLYFARAKAVAIPSTTFFSPDNTLKFYPQSTYTFASSSMEYDSYSQEYYIDVLLEAESEGTDYNLDSGSLLYFSSFDTYFLRGEINYLSQSATASETNSEFIDRASTAISTRNLINAPSIEARIGAEFTAYDDISVIGAGDDLMIRDLVWVYSQALLGNVQVHLGGKVDIYSRVELGSEVIQCTIDSSGLAHIEGPVYDFERSEVTGGTEADTLGTDEGTDAEWYLEGRTTAAISTVAYADGYLTFTLSDHGLSVGSYFELNDVSYRVSETTQNTVTAPTSQTGSGTFSATLKYSHPEDDLGFSTRQVLVVDFGVAHAGKTVSFTTRYFTGLSSLQTYLEDSDNRVVCADYLARGYNLYKLNFNIVSYGSISVDASTCADAIDAYLTSLAPGQAFIMSDLQAKLFEAGVTSIQTPISTTYTLYNRNQTTPLTGTITDVLNPNDATTIFAVETIDVSSANV